MAWYPRGGRFLEVGSKKDGKKYHQYIYIYIIYIYPRDFPYSPILPTLGRIWILRVQQLNLESHVWGWVDKFVMPLFLVVPLGNRTIDKVPMHWSNIPQKDGPGASDVVMRRDIIQNNFRSTYRCRSDMWTFKDIYEMLNPSEAQYFFIGIFKGGMICFHARRHPFVLPHDVVPFLVEKNLWPQHKARQLHRYWTHLRDGDANLGNISPDNSHIPLWFWADEAECNEQTSVLVVAMGCILDNRSYSLDFCFPLTFCRVDACCQSRTIFIYPPKMCLCLVNILFYTFDLLVPILTSSLRMTWLAGEPGPASCARWLGIHTKRLHRSMQFGFSLVVPMSGACFGKMVSWCLKVIN